MTKSKELKEYADEVCMRIFGRSLSESQKYGICVTCGRSIDGFRDELSAKEYDFSGMCQKCQDEAFLSEEGRCRKMAAPLVTKYPPSQCPVCWEDNTLEGENEYYLQEGEQVFLNEDYTCTNCGFEAMCSYLYRGRAYTFSIPDKEVKDNMVYAAKLFGLFKDSDLI